MTTMPRIETTMVTTRDPWLQKLHDLGLLKKRLWLAGWLFFGKTNHVLTVFFYIGSQIFLTSSQCQVANAEDCSSQGVEMLLTRQWIGWKFTANHGKARCKPWCLLSTKGISCFSWGISDHFRIFSDWPSLEQRNWHHLEQVKVRRSRGVCHAIRRTMFPIPINRCL